MRGHRHRWRHGFREGLAHVGFRLHRRVFAWIAFSIALTAGAVGLGMHVLGRSSGFMWEREARGAQQLVGGLFAQAWSDPARREALLGDLSRDLDVRGVLKDASGAVVAQTGAACPKAMVGFDVMQGSQRLGRVELCADWYASHRSHVFLAIGIAVVMLWLAAGAMSRRMLRPLSMAIDVAEQLGNGNLKSRAPVDCHRGGEERALANALNRMADRIERQMADQRELLAQVSHELRTPLGHLRLLLELAREKPEAKTLDEFEKEIAEIDSLVGDLLASSRLSFEALNTRDLDARELAARALERAGIGADKLRAEGAPHVNGDATLLMRALANLLENAKVHGGAVESLRVDAADGKVRFTVTDRGPGFAEGDAARAFEAFFHRPRATDGEGGSLGLGLALVQRIAQAHGGSASAQNRAEGGAEVAFTVAAAPANVPAAASS